MSCLYCKGSLTQARHSYCENCRKLRKKIAKDDYRGLALAQPPRKVIVCYQRFDTILKTSKMLLEEFSQFVDSKGELEVSIHYFYSKLPLDPEVTHAWIERVK